MKMVRDNDTKIFRVIKLNIKLFFLYLLTLRLQGQVGITFDLETVKIIVKTFDAMYQVKKRLSMLYNMEKFKYNDFVYYDHTKQVLLRYGYPKNRLQLHIVIPESEYLEMNSSCQVQAVTIKKKQIVCGCGGN